MLDKGDLRHNHEPQSVDFIESNKSKEVTQEQRAFITYMFEQNSQINGSEVRAKFREEYPEMQDMFPKKV